MQVDETTCGSAVLAMLGLAGDPQAALRLASGDPAGRFMRLQQAIHTATNRRGLVVASWPRSTAPPWGAARFASYGGVRYTRRVTGSRALLEAAVASARAGIPVPLYTGGDVTSGWDSAVPRHVVLLTLADGEGTEGSAVLYEPSGAGLTPSRWRRCSTRRRRRPAGRRRRRPPPIAPPRASARR